MKNEVISDIQIQMRPVLDQGQLMRLTKVLKNTLENYEMKNITYREEMDNDSVLKSFLSAKQLEGCSARTIQAYGVALKKMYNLIDKNVDEITTDDLRKYLFDYKNTSNPSKTTIDNLRRIFSSFFAWLEEEDYILKNPVKRIHKVKSGKVVRETLSDENLELLRDSCDNLRDKAMFEMLLSTGIRVGELVNLNISDVDFVEREAIVYGKGDSQRIVYFDAKAKLSLKKYLDSRVDDNPALFVQFRRPWNRHGIRGVEKRIRDLGLKCNIENVHPHRFRRTLATKAIDKGMPIEQVQKLLGHTQIDTTMHYAMVDQSNVKISHRKYIS